MENMMLLILGICISVLGIVNIRGNISTIHSYNRRKVKEEDVPKYGKAVGTGTLIMGISLVLACIAAFWNESMMPLYRFSGSYHWLGIYPVRANQVQPRHFLMLRKQPCKRRILQGCFLLMKKALAAQATLRMEG